MKSKALLILLAALFLTGCGAVGNTAPTAMPTIVLDSSGASPSLSASESSASVTASGVVVPAQQAQMAFPLAGNIQAIDVAVGEAVEAGQVLGRLAGNEQQQAALSAAELGVLTAQQDLDRLQEGAGLAAAQAQQSLVAAQKAYEDAQKARDRLDRPRASSETIQSAEANYYLAQAAVDDAEGAFNRVSGALETDVARANALANLANAKKARDKALVNLNWYKGHAGEKEYTEADANLAVAQAQLDGAQREWDRLKDGPDAAQLALLQAHLKSAQDQAAAARASLANLELKAPFSGTVSAVNAHSGEWVIPGQPVLVLADLEHLRVSTTDLSERDVPQIEIGQPAAVFIEALNLDVTGKVVEISPLADTLGGDVVYKTTVELDKSAPGLRAGMSVEVQFQTGE